MKKPCIFTQKIVTFEKQNIFIEKLRQNFLTFIIMMTNQFTHKAQGTYTFERGFGWNASCDKTNSIIGLKRLG